ncbi:MAG: hydantoinase B/oxoprolinase family protein, partial [Rhodospirillales bacterium]|nr:hydantoinase B/oxoprolinase family protein [Rhodospirillales bacterium]
MQFDPIVLEILNNKVAAAAEEMKSALQRTSRSMFVKEAADFGVGLVGIDGLIFGYPSSASTQFVIDSDSRATIDSVADLAPGDVIVTNDPYRSEGFATHLPDIQMLKPYFHRGRIVAWGWCFAHFTDIGGRVPSSISPTNSELFQEGLIIPPMKIVKRGVLNQDFVTVFTANSRIPDINMGDVHAMLGSLAIGGQRVADIIERHGVDSFVAAQGALLDYSADKARDVLRLIPDGAYEFWDYMDDDAVSPIPVRVRVCMVVDDGRVLLDVCDTDPQVGGAYNVPTFGRRNYWFTMRFTNFLLTHDPTIAQNAGMYRHISVINPPGTIMNAEFPDPVGIRQATAR